MRIKNYYLIRPKAVLVERLPEMDELSIDTLSEPQLWESEEGGKSLWSLEDYAARAKLVFLMNLHAEYAGVDGIQSILATAKISVSLFDAFWSIEPAPLTGTVAEIPFNSIPSSEVEFSGMPCVDDWLLRMIKTP